VSPKDLFNGFRAIEIVEYAIAMASFCPHIFATKGPAQLPPDVWGERKGQVTIGGRGESITCEEHTRDDRRSRACQATNEQRRLHFQSTGGATKSRALHIKRRVDDRRTAETDAIEKALSAHGLLPQKAADYRPVAAKFCDKAA
jgi:hypothetical protein